MLNDGAESADDERWCGIGDGINSNNNNNNITTGNGTSNGMHTTL